MFLLSSCRLMRPVCFIFCVDLPARDVPLPSTFFFFSKPQYSVGLQCMNPSSHLSREEFIRNVLHRTGGN